MRRIATALAAGALLALGATGFALAGAGHGSTEAEEGHTKIVVGHTEAEEGHAEAEEGHAEAEEGHAEAEEGHADDVAMMPGMMSGSVDEMREMHKQHEHGHDFAVMDELSPGQLTRMMGLMTDVGVTMPPMDAARGRLLFVEKGCIACHSVNGVGGDLGPALNAGDMPRPMNSFEFVARMWRGARAMTEMQEDLLGEVISLDGQDLADLVVFAHDPEEQAKLTKDQIPERYHELIGE